MKTAFDNAVQAARIKCLGKLFKNLNSLFDSSNIENTKRRLEFGLGGLGFVDEPLIEKEMNDFVGSFVPEFLNTNPENLRKLILSHKSGKPSLLRAPIGTEESHIAIKDWLLECVYQDFPSHMCDEATQDARAESSIIALARPQSENI